MKDTKKVIILIVIIILVVPLIINLLFKIEAYNIIFEAEWDASAALAYWGTIMASGITIYGVFLTIYYSQRNNIEESNHQVLPFISVDLLKSKIIYHSNDVEERINEEEKYIEFKQDKYYITIEGGKIHFVDKLSQVQKDLIKNNGLKNEFIKSGIRCVKVDILWYILEIENIGNGTALRLQCSMKRINGNINEGFAPVMVLNKNATIKIYIFRGLQC